MGDNMAGAQLLLRERLTDRRGGHHPTVQRHEPDPLDVESPLGTHLPQDRHGAGGAVAEREVVPDDDVPRGEPLDEHPVDELLGRPPGELVRELQHDERVDPRRGDQLGLAVERRQQPGLTAGGEHLAGMPVEGHGDRHQVALPGNLDRPPDHPSVPQVDPVEEPDGHCRRLPAERQRADPPDHVHTGPERTGHRQGRAPKRASQGTGPTAHRRG